MKNIDTLITSIVFQVTGFNPYSCAESNLAAIKRLLPFAHVSKIWRQPLLQHIYGVAKLEHHCSSHKPSGGIPWYTYTNTYSGLTWCWWESNIDLIGRNGFSSTTTKLEMDLDYPRIHQEISLENILIKFNLDAYQWPNLVYLWITNTAGPYNTGKEICKRRESICNEDLAQMTAVYLKRSLPNINRLVLSSRYFDDPVTELTNHRILHCFLPQLTELHAFEPISFAVPTLPDELVYLNIRLKPMDRFWFPRFDPAKLDNLTLSLCASDFSWSRMLNSDSSHVRLDRFYYLYLGFTKHNHTSGSRSLQLMDDLKTSHLEPVSVLELPQVRSLSIKDPPSDLVFEPTIILGDCSSISLIGKLPELTNCTNIQYETLGEYIINIKELVVEEMDEFYVLTNRLFGSFMVATEMTLIVGSKTSIDLEADVLQWFNLTRLRLNYNVKFAMVLAIVPQIPNLTYLYIDWLSVQDQDVCLLADDRTKKSVTGWETRIRELSVFEGKSVDDPNLPANPDLVVYLAKRMPLLEKLCVTESISKIIRDRFSCEVSWYPHLQDVVI